MFFVTFSSHFISSHSSCSKRDSPVQIVWVIRRDAKLESIRLFFFHICFVTSTIYKRLIRFGFVVFAYPSESVACSAVIHEMFGSIPARSCSVCSTHPFRFSDFTNSICVLYSSVVLHGGVFIRQFDKNQSKPKKRVSRVRRETESESEKE